MQQDKDAKLCTTAKRVLFNNIVEIETVVGFLRKKRKYLLAGNGVGRAIWVRDCCLCARALVSAGYTQPVFNLVQLYIENLDANMTPIEVFDNVSPVWRQIKCAMSRYFGAPVSKGPQSPHPYTSTSGAFINHLLVVYAATYLPESSRVELFTQYTEKIKAMLEWYAPYAESGLVWQPESSDRLTYSVSPEGCHFFTNLLLLEVQTRLSHSNFPFIVDPSTLRERLLEFRTPMSAGLFVSVLHSQTIRLDDNLFAVSWSMQQGRGIFEKRVDVTEHFNNILASPLWQGFIGQIHGVDSRTDCLCCIDRHEAPETTGFAGFAAWPSPDNQGFWSKVCGTQDVQYGAYWSWLVAFAREVQYFVTFDVGAPLPCAMYKHAEENKFYDVMRHKTDLPPFQTCLFSSNSKSSLGAAHVYLYMKTVRSRKNEYI